MATGIVASIGILGTTGATADSQSGSVVGQINSDGYYTVNDGTDFIRSKNPQDVDGVDGGTVSQSPASRGAVELSIDGTETYSDCGFYIDVGPLDSIDSIDVGTEGPDTVGLNLYFDVNEDGEYFEWERGQGNSGTYTGTGDDEYMLGDVDGSGDFTVDDSTDFFDGSTSAGDTSLEELKDGAVEGVDGETPVAVWVGITASNGGTLSATVDTVDVSTS